MQSGYTKFIYHAQPNIFTKQILNQCSCWVFNMFGFYVFYTHTTLAPSCISRSLFYPKCVLLIPANYYNVFDCYDLNDVVPAKSRSRATAAKRSPKTHMCRACGHRYGRQDTLVNHMRFECGKVPRFTCNWCTYRTKWSGNLTKHRRNRHPELYRAWASRRKGFRDIE